MMMSLSLETPRPPSTTHSSGTPRGADTRVYRAGQHRPETLDTQSPTCICAQAPPTRQHVMTLPPPVFTPSFGVLFLSCVCVFV